MAYQHLTEAEFDWTLDLLARGGECLQGYPDYHRLQEINGVWQVSNARVARRHRMTLGTIVSAVGQCSLCERTSTWSHRRVLCRQIKPGDRFLFAGRCLSFVRLKDMVCQVKSARGQRPQLPSWVAIACRLASN